MPWLVGAAAGLLYAATAAPSIVRLDDDSLEFQLVAPILGIAHPTGYPLYTLLGWFWSQLLLPVGNWAWRMNLFSAAAGATTVALVYVAALRTVALRAGPASALAGLAAASTFGLGALWWQQTTVAEVYALHNLFVAALLVTALSLPVQTAADPNDPALRRRLLWLWLLVGLSLTHHRTAVLLIPPVALYVTLRLGRRLLGGRRQALRIGGQWLAALVLPLALYAYIPLRAAQGVRDLNGDYVHSWSGFWYHVLAQGYTAFLQPQGSTGDLWVGEGLRLLGHHLGLPALLLASLGLAWLGWRPGPGRGAASLIGSVLLLNLAFTLAYRVADAQVFLLPALLSASVAAAAGVGALGQWSRGRWVLSPADGQRPAVPTPACLVQWAAVAALLVPLLATGPRPTYDWRAHDYAVAMATVPFPPQSQVIGIVGEVVALQYMQRAERLGESALPVAADDEAVRRHRIAAGVAAGRPVYLTRELPGIETEYSFGGFGPLVRVWPRGQAQAGTPQHPLGIWLADGKLQAVGYDLVTLQQAAGLAAEIALYWRPQSRLEQTLKLSLRWQDRQGSSVQPVDGTPPTADLFPLRQVAATWAWLPGELVRDVYTLAIPQSTPPAAQLLLIVYDADSLIEVGRLTLPLPALGPAR